MIRMGHAGPKRAAFGFTYLGVLFLVGLMALTGAMAGVVWTTERRREDERQLVFVGRQFQAAIERYRERSRDNKQEAVPYPRQLKDLVRDDRFAQPQRHLRRIYFDPMTGNTQWGLIRMPDGGIVGVHSLSDRKPFARTYVMRGFPVPSEESYRKWRFVAPSAADMVGTPPG